MMIFHDINRDINISLKTRKSMVKQILHQSAGLTLIETIISIALIAIIALSMLTVFTVGMKMTASAGTRSKAVYEAQGNVEQDLTTNNTNPLSTVTLSSTDGTTTITVDGIETTESVTIGNTTIAIDYFQPTY